VSTRASNDGCSLATTELWPSQAAAFTTIGTAKTGVPSTVFKAQRQLGGPWG